MTGGKKRFSLIPRRNSHPTSSQTASEVAKEVQLRIGTHGVAGTKHPDRSEDRMFVGTPFGEKLLEESILSGYAAVFDGHGGYSCAEYVCEKMVKKVGDSFRSEESWERADDLLKDLFHNLDKEFCKQATEEDDTSGACGTVVVVRVDEAFVANVGDCRAAQYTAKGKLVKASTDHRAGSEEEMRRISLAGGKVEKGRVGSLEPSRTFGDIDVKEKAGEKVIISTPAVERYTFEGKGDFLIVATDGLWDAVSSASAGKVCKKALGKQQDPAAAAKALVAHAVLAGSTDDISVVVLLF